MSWVTPRTWVAAETVTAAQMNGIRDNLNATAPAKAAAAGDVFYATAENAIAVRPIGGPGAALVVNAGGTTPFWGAATHINEFRLTLETGVPVSTSDQTAKTTIYLTPYAGDRIAIWDSGSGWLQLESAQISVAVPSTTVTPFDIFAYDNSGTLTLEVLDWENDTTRATALVYQDGVLVKSGATGRRYLGTGRTTGVSGETEDSETVRFLWNYNNRVQRAMHKLDATSHSYSSATPRIWNNDSANKCEFVLGVLEEHLKISIGANINPGADDRSGIVEVYFDGGVIQPRRSNLPLQPVYAGNTAIHVPSIGYHEYSIFESVVSANSVTFAVAHLDFFING